MTTKNQTETIQGFNENGSRLPTESVKDGTHNKRLAKNCPWVGMEHIIYCSKIPSNFICGEPDCWELGEMSKELRLYQLSDEDYKKFIEAVILVKPKIIKKLLKKYKDPPNPDDFKN